MAVYTFVSAEALEAFLAYYDVGDITAFKGIAEGVENTNYLVDTTRGRFILTLYEKRVAAADLPYFTRLMTSLADVGIPAPRVIPSRDGDAIGRCAGRPACLIEFLSGVSPGLPDPRQAHSAGAALAAMHHATRGFLPSRDNTLGMETWPGLLERCGADLDRIASDLRDRLTSALARILESWPTALPYGTIHADLFPDNVLMLGERVTGLIDFYFACTDLLAYDLAVMHSAWTFDLAGDPLAPQVGRALLAGYETTRPLGDAERAAMPILAQGACLRFALTRAWDWLNTPADALVTRKDPLAYLNRLDWYAAHPEAFA